MFETLVEFYSVWKLEIFISVLLVAFPFVKSHFKNNTILAAFIQQATERIAEVMEAKNVDPETGEKPNMKRSEQKARRRKIRAQLAKEARKQQRGKTKKKGPKKAGNK